jgi:hypothetical protein
MPTTISPITAVWQALCQPGTKARGTDDDRKLQQRAKEQRFTLVLGQEAGRTWHSHQIMPPLIDMTCAVT